LKVIDLFNLETAKKEMEFENSAWQWVKMMQAVLSFKRNRIF